MKVGLKWATPPQGRYCFGGTPMQTFAEAR